MGITDKLMKALNMNTEENEEYDELSEDYVDLDGNEEEEFEDEEDVNERKPSWRERRRARKRERNRLAMEEVDDTEEDPEYEPDSYDEIEEETETKKARAVSQPNTPRLVSGRNGKSANSEVCMILARSFEDAPAIADVLLQHKAVVLNMEGLDISSAQRIIDFASGTCYTLGGNLQRISRMIFMIVPEDMDLSGDFNELVGDMVNLDRNR